MLPKFHLDEILSYYTTNSSESFILYIYIYIKIKVMSLTLSLPNDTMQASKENITLQN